MTLDTFTTVVALTVFFFIYMGERFKTGAYLLLAIPFLILLAWRMGEVVYYISSAAAIAILVHRSFFSSDDVRDESGD